ncbi:hypothetical protein J0656_11640 [Muricauda ruestringensis]|uniref:Conjugative transposon protein TraJ n=1 Tax=Flagellimonas aurea TaxID=2915619 RepID=A0ABS3G6X3_9FLAO|nr:hypothetical protein [Allomuricauda aurea]MAO16239.1 hypothetical protein [Allomuricauda sp.]MBO0354668.1 hypothetical protein [Allomuricauda aurea]|tara:strand:- start:695 stop:1519 length:825 start_codon:yes stop_codon:yes gene_type:complete
MGLEYVDAVFQTIMDSSFASYTIGGMKALAVLFFLINIIKKYYEGGTTRTGLTWGLTPTDLIRNFAVVLVVLFSTEVLGTFDTILVAIEGQYRETAPELIPLGLQEVEVTEEPGLLDAASKAMGLLYEWLSTPFLGLRTLAWMGSVVLWILDLFIYPLFLAERYFILGVMQAFFPLVISMAVFEKFREMGYRFFRLYAAVYMIVPAFFLVNVFVNTLYQEVVENFWPNLFGTDFGSELFAPVIELAGIGFIVLLKFKLYKRATTFTFRLFAGGA